MWVLWCCVFLEQGVVKGKGSQRGGSWIPCWSPADTDHVRQDTYIGLTPGRCGVSWSRVWLTIPVSLISALFMLLSQPFISIFIPRSLILQYISCDGVGCSDDSLWGKPITEYSSSYWYQKTVEWTSVLRSNLCMLLKTLANIHPHQNSAVKNKIKIKDKKENAVLASLSYLYINF